jgi:hypothetical protein
MNDLRTAKTLIFRKQSRSKYATVNGFICIDTPRATVERIPKRLFFFLRCREQATKQNNKSFGPTSPGVARDSFFLFSFSLFIYLFY